MTERVAVILAAGKGTRMRSELAKVLHPFCGAPLVTHPVRAALGAGATRIVVITGHQEQAVREAVLAVPELPPGAVRFAHQAQQNGTGHAVLCALPEIPDGDALVWILSGDTPMIRPQTLARIAQAAQSSTAGLAVSTLQAEGKTGYGRLLRDEAGDPMCIREERDCDAEALAVTECNAGMYCVRASHLHAELPTLGADNAQGEIYLTDLVEVRARSGTVAVLALDPIEAAGVNTPEQLAALEAEANG